MEEKKAKRKLTAILSADVKGYSNLMQDDEEATVRTITEYRLVMSTLVQGHDGRVVDAKGDNLLAEFPSVVDAVRCAVEIQKELKGRNEGLPENRKMEFRIGINLGDVIEEDDTIYGDGVNIAARLEGLAEGGGICISRMAFDNVKNKLDVGYEYLGEHSVKNIAEPVRVYKVLMEPEFAGRVLDEEGPKPKQWRWLAVATVLIVLAGAFAIWNFYFRPPPIEPASLDEMAFPLPDKPSIAVLPFDNMSGDPEQEYFSDGLTEEIITALSKTDQLFVIARNSTFTYKGKPVKVQQVAEDLGIRYVLEGSVRKDSERLRITAQLVDAIEGIHLWAERYDRDLRDIFAIQDDITKQITAALHVKLTIGGDALQIAGGTDSLEAFLKYLKSREYHMRQTKEDNVISRRLAEEAISIDPEYGSAYALLGATHMLDAWLQATDSPKRSIGKAIELERKAIALGANAHDLLGFLYLTIRQHDKAIVECQKAVDLNPSSATARTFYGLALGSSGRFEEAVLELEQGVRLDPFSSSFSLRSLGNAYSFLGRHEEAISVCKKAVQRAPNDLISHLILTRAYSMADRMEEARAGAAEILRINPKFSLESYSRTLNFKNQADDDRLIEALRNAGLPEHPPLSLPDKPSIAVLPFDNLSGDPEQDYFAAGLTDDVITRLSRFRDLFVIARNSVFTYKGKSTTVQQVSRELGVRYILKGGVNKGKDKIHITAHLIDTDSGHHVWAHRYERDLKDIFAVQNEIAASIVATLGGLQGQITNVLLERTARKRTDNLKAYDLVLRGDELNIRFTKETNAKARKLFEEAIRLDPNYALAYADLAWNYCFAYMLQFGPSPEEDLQKGFELAKKAISLDDADAESHWVLGFAYLMKRDHDRSLAAYERALALNPDYADLLADMGYALTCVGRAQEGIAHTERAMRLNPFYPDWYLWVIGMAQYTMHRYEDAVATLKKMTDFPIEPRLYLAASYAQLGRLEEARTELTEILKLDPGANLKSWGHSQHFKNKVDSEHFFEGLRKAGLPE